MNGGKICVFQKPLEKKIGSKTNDHEFVCLNVMENR